MTAIILRGKTIDYRQIQNALHMGIVQNNCDESRGRKKKEKKPLKSKQ